MIAASKSSRVEYTGGDQSTSAQSIVVAAAPYEAHRKTSPVVIIVADEALFINYEEEVTFEIVALIPPETGNPSSRLPVAEMRFVVGDLLAQLKIF